jgi:glycosyltransferase involved in cell wall biosynthesis
VIPLSLRVLHLGKFYPPHDGGMETHLRDLAVRQAKQMQVRVMVANSARQDERSVTDGVDVWRLARWGMIASMPVCPRMVWAIRQSPADLVHLHMPNPGAAFAFLLSGHRGKLVLTHHADTLGRKTLRKFSDGFVKATMDRADAIIVTSRRYLDSSEELAPYRAKCHVIPLGIDPKPIGPGPRRTLDTRAVDGRPNLLAIGRLVPYKGFDVLLRAMQQVEAHLTIIGTGPQRAELQSLSERTQVSDKVSILGRVEDLRPYFEAASIFVLPSVTRAEAFGIVQMEAMAAEIPVINTDIDSGVPEVSLHCKSGLTVPPGDANALADAINQLLSQPNLCRQYGAAGRERVLKEFNVDSMVEKTLVVYRTFREQSTGLQVPQ